MRVDASRNHHDISDDGDVGAGEKGDKSRGRAGMGAITRSQWCLTVGWEMERGPLYHTKHSTGACSLIPTPVPHLSMIYW